ncbi:MAG TPA: Nif3-like dinuclear metal center hexameric protein [Puia sp.]|nr:Nif3-like dinuclear metal center hexameric protein [Puia sp.]
MQRRDFLSTTLAAVAASSLPFSRSFGAGRRDVTVQQVIDALIADIPGAPFQDTVDTIKSGDPSALVKGIVTTMFPTDALVRQTIDLGANFIIAHEPTFYSGGDSRDWLADDPIYHYKLDFLNQHGIVIWRFHDGIHAHKPDGIRMGVMQAVGWDQYYTPDNPELVSLPSAATLGELIQLFKKNLGIEHVRYIGDLSQSCGRVVLSPGAYNGRIQMNLLQKYEPELFICGEIREWETNQYILDARYQGKKMALLILGHSLSEEPGMQWLSSVLKQKFPEVPVTHLPSGDPFQWG